LTLSQNDLNPLELGEEKYSAADRCAAAQHVTVWEFSAEFISENLCARGLKPKFHRCIDEHVVLDPCHGATLPLGDYYGAYRLVATRRSDAPWRGHRFAADLRVNQPVEGFGG